MINQQILAHHGLRGFFRAVSLPRKTVVAALVILAGAVYTRPASGQTLLAGYDFQTTANGGTAAKTAPNSPLAYLASFGTQAGNAGLYLDGTHGSSIFTSGNSAPQVTAFTGTAVNAGAGFSTSITGAASLGLANSNANGLNVVFALSTTGYQGLTLSFASEGSSTGFKGNTFSYSTDGTNFTLLTGSVTPTTSFTTFTEDFSGITVLNNASTVYIEYTLEGASSSTGNNRLDNIQFNANAVGSVPEPTTLFGGALVFVAFGWSQRRRLRGWSAIPLQ